MFNKFTRPGPIDFIIAGLGNPGKKYELTRHNAGFMALDALAENLSVKVDRMKYHALCGEAKIGDKRVLLMKPQTFMNLSGESVCEAMKFYKIPPENTLILFDDISLEPGTMRIRRKGSCGGQNGMRNIIDIAGSENFPRIKIGIGKKPHPDYDLADWVLSRFKSDEVKLLNEVFERSTAAAKLIVEGKTDEAMNKYSR